MKVKNITFIVLVFLALLSCNELDIKDDTPNCIENLIIEFEKENTCETGVNVKKYMFQENTVYVFEPGTCGADLIANVYNTECNNIGFLGGIMGNLIINGENFTNAQLECIVWEK